MFKCQVDVSQKKRSKWTYCKLGLAKTNLKNMDRTIQNLQRCTSNAIFHPSLHERVVVATDGRTDDYVTTNISWSDSSIFLPIQCTPLHLKEKALHALFSLRKHTNFSKLKPSLACKIFETMISPILSYNSEIWGVYVKHDFKAWDNTPIEKTHLKFCKRYLEISNKASNVASRSELGRFAINY